MITTKDKMINQLLATIYVDKDDKTVLHVNMDNALRALIDSGLIIPKKQFEMTAQAVLDKYILGTPTGKITHYAMAEIMYTLAMKLAISKEEILSYKLSHKSDDVQFTD